MSRAEPSRVEPLRNTWFLCDIGRTTWDESTSWVSARAVALFLFVFCLKICIYAMIKLLIDGSIYDADDDSNYCDGEEMR